MDSTREIRTLKDVQDAISDLPSLWAKEHWWRGEPAQKKEWPLVPKIFRTDHPYSHPYETDLTFHFMRNAPTIHHDCPHREDHVSWLFLMQHYGLRTRLLDWTESPLVALYLAVSDTEHDSDPATLWLLQPCELNKKANQQYGICKPEAFIVRTLCDIAFGAIPASRAIVVATFPWQIDPRMAVQLSAFTLHGSDEPLDQFTEADTFLRKYTIPADAKPNLRYWLTTFGIRRSLLFPDLDTLAGELSIFADRSMWPPSTQPSP